MRVPQKVLVLSFALAEPKSANLHIKDEEKEEEVEEDKFEKGSKDEFDEGAEAA